MTKLVKSFDEGLIPNFVETWGTKNIFNPKIINRINWLICERSLKVIYYKYMSINFFSSNKRF